MLPRIMYIFDFRKLKNKESSLGRLHKLLSYVVTIFDTQTHKKFLGASCVLDRRD